MLRRQAAWWSKQVITAAKIQNKCVPTREIRYKTAVLPILTAGKTDIVLTEVTGEARTIHYYIYVISSRQEECAVRNPVLRERKRAAGLPAALLRLNRLLRYSVGRGRYQLSMLRR